MATAEFDTLLKQTMGLDAASIGASAIERAVQTRMKACNLTEPQAYWNRLRGSAGEVQELIESVVVPETWFFRHREAFPAMVHIVLDEWLPSRPGRELRVLSVPCSTGEEPYSIAMALLDAGFPAARLRIDAVDISRRALSVAKRADYGRNSFRGDDLSFRDRHFNETAAGYHLADSVSRHVRFHHGNLLDPGFLPGAVYDVIFCRNMLIYFDGATQDRAVAVLARLLSVNGAVFVGPSEGNVMLDHGFVPARVPRAFAFRKAAPGAVAACSSHREPALVQPGHAPPPDTSTPAPAPRTHRPAPQRAEGVSVDEARRLADRGHLAEAARLCDQLLRSRTVSPDVFYLLGLIREATGNQDDAATCYRKALYLKPGHKEALAHLALLLQGQGDGAGARILTDRLRRLESRAGE